MIWTGSVSFGFLGVEKEGKESLRRLLNKKKACDGALPCGTSSTKPPRIRGECIRADSPLYKK
jgi:hypothetical protein